MKLLTYAVKFDGDKSHYLYAVTPKEVIIKIDRHLATNQIPSLNSDILNDMEKFFENADAILYPTEKNARWIEKQFDLFTTVLAIMAFIPGGFDLFGRHYEVIQDGSSET